MAERARARFTKSDTASIEAGTITAKTEVKTVAEANPNRIELFVTNDGEKTVYLALGATAVANKGIRLNEKGGAVVISGYLGKVTCITKEGEAALCTAEV